MKFFEKLPIDRFVLALLSVILIAAYSKELRIYEFLLPLSKVSSIGVSIIFFLYGAKLGKDKLRAGFSNHKLNISIQLFTFLLFPIVVFSTKNILPFDDFKEIYLGVFYLAALPSTVSSSVIMVSIAKGNLPSAIFNASISGLIGVFLTPLIMGLVLTISGNSDVNILDIYLKLFVQVILPVFAGSFFNSKLGSFLAKNGEKMKLVDQSLILMIVYASFSESFQGDLLTNLSFTQIMSLILYMLALFFGIYYLTKKISTFLNFNKEDITTAIFCGSKKSLVHGVVMAKVIFFDPKIIGIVLIPVMIYHTIQLIASGILAKKIAKSYLLE
jgi:solute carrier family 10 (sodium/bile acid cotransporter), member 7